MINWLNTNLVIVETKARLEYNSIILTQCWKVGHFLTLCRGRSFCSKIYLALCMKVCLKELINKWIPLVLKDGKVRKYLHRAKDMFRTMNKQNYLCFRESGRLSELLTCSFEVVCGPVEGVSLPRHTPNFSKSGGRHAEPHNNQYGVPLWPKQLLQWCYLRRAGARSCCSSPPPSPSQEDRSASHRFLPSFAAPYFLHFLYSHSLPLFLSFTRMHAPPHPRTRFEFPASECPWLCNSADENTKTDTGHPSILAKISFFRQMPSCASVILAFGQADTMPK